MKKLTVLAVAASALLAVAGSAQAKEIVGLKVCGASGCNESSDHLVIDSSTAASSTTPARYYAVELRFGDGEGQTIIHREQAYWLPDSGWMRFATDVNGSWWKPADLSGLQTAAGGIEAFTPELSKVTVKGKVAADPSSYLRLLGRLPFRVLPRGKLHLVPVKLTAATPNPWVTGTTVLRYDAKRHLLIRPDGYFRLSPSLGRLVMKHASLRAAASGSGGGHTALYAGLGAGGFGALAVLGVARRKKMH